MHRVHSHEVLMAGCCASEMNVLKSGEGSELRDVKRKSRTSLECEHVSAFLNTCCHEQLSLEGKTRIPASSANVCHRTLPLPRSCSRRLHWRSAENGPACMSSSSKTSSFTASNDACIMIDGSRVRAFLSNGHGVPCPGTTASRRAIGRNPFEHRRKSLRAVRGGRRAVPSSPPSLPQAATCSVETRPGLYLLP